VNTLLLNKIILIIRINYKILLPWLPLGATRLEDESVEEQLETDHSTLCPNSLETFEAALGQ
jgi:hypothetical protein